jgi:hypothetical protein
MPPPELSTAAVQARDRAESAEGEVSALQHSFDEQLAIMSEHMLGPLSCLLSLTRARAHLVFLFFGRFD